MLPKNTSVVAMSSALADYHLQPYVGRSTRQPVDGRGLCTSANQNFCTTHKIKEREPIVSDFTRFITIRYGCSPFRQSVSTLLCVSLQTGMLKKNRPVDSSGYFACQILSDSSQFFFSSENARSLRGNRTRISW